MHSYLANSEPQIPSTAQVIRESEYRGASISASKTPIHYFNDFFQACANFYTLLFEQQSEKTSADMHSQSKQYLPLTVKDISEEVRNTFGINALQLAKLAGVSRATLYNHINGSEAPKNFDRYRQLHEAALEVRAVAPEGVKSGLKNVLVEGKTLLSHLKSDYADPKKIASVAKKVAEKQPNKASSNLTLEEKKHQIRKLSKQG